MKKTTYLKVKMQLFKAIFDVSFATGEGDILLSHVFPGFQVDSDSTLKKVASGVCSVEILLLHGVTMCKHRFKFLNLIILKIMHKTVGIYIKTARANQKSGTTVYIWLFEKQARYQHKPNDADTEKWVSSVQSTGLSTA